MKIRVLHLEDDAADSELVKLWLGNAGVGSELVRVESRDAFTAALDEGRFEFRDSKGAARIGARKLTPVATVKSGRIYGSASIPVVRA